MLRAGRLLDLQEHDLTIERIDQQLTDIAARLTETDELRAARLELASATSVVAGLEARRKDIDGQVQDVRAKREREEKRLYSGTVNTPREIQNLEREVDSLRKRTIELEDRELNVMGDLEEADAVRVMAASAAAAAEQQWTDDQADLRRQQIDLTERRARAVIQRDAKLRQVDPADLPGYQSLRTKLAGRAVSRIERGVCSACRVSLPEREIQKARTSPTMVMCSNCGRILYAG